MPTLIDKNLWTAYISLLRRCNEYSAKSVVKIYSRRRPTTESEWRDFLAETYAIIDNYGSAAAEAACEFYEEVAAVYGKNVLSALPADSPAFSEVAAAITAAAKTQNPALIGNVAYRFVKQRAADTTLKNAIRDGAEFAWVPHGDTCAFCLALASRGWQRMGKKARRGVHATHIHANCDCNYAIRFGSSGGVEDYDPEEYYDAYMNASDSVNPNDKINALRRDYYSRHADEINAQKRAAYRERVEREKVSKMDTDT